MGTPLRAVQGGAVRQFSGTDDAPLNSGSGGGTYGGMPPDLPERVGKVETHIEHINKNIATIQGDVREIRTGMTTDFRITWGGLIFVALGLAGLMAKGFHWI